MRRIFFTTFFILIGFTLFSQENISLPQPQKTGGMPLMEALAKRSTSRSYQSKELTNQQLSSLLWAAFGINRPDGKRTAPLARNFQETIFRVGYPKLDNSKIGKPFSSFL